MAPTSGLGFRRPDELGAQDAIIASPVHMVVCLGIVAAVFCFFFKRKKKAVEQTRAIVAPAGASKTAVASAATNTLLLNEAAVRNLAMQAARQLAAGSAAEADAKDVEGIEIDHVQLLKSQVAVVSVTVDADYDLMCNDEQDRLSYSMSLIRAVSSDLGIPVACVGVGALQRGSIIAELLLVERPSTAPGGKGNGGREQGNVDVHSLAGWHTYIRTHCILARLDIHANLQTCMYASCMQVQVAAKYA